MLSRVWIIVHTYGVMAGDELEVGLQAEHILRGELPLYYFGQAYLGSLDAYLAALIFRFTGPAVWAMRLEMIPMSLLLVYLTWRFAAILAETAHLSARLKTIFMTIAALVAAFPPLYDMIMELRLGGYMGAFVIMLWLLFCAFRLTQRWGQQASWRELALRWVGICLLVGLGLWIDPLIMYATAANSHLVPFGLFVVFSGLVLGVAGLFLARRRPVFVRVRQLTALPLLFMLCVSIIFCITPNSAAALGSAGCGPSDGAGRYVVPLVDALPFLIATLIVFPGLVLRERQWSQAQQGEDAHRALRFTTSRR